MARGRVDVYTIPPNFAEDGTIFSGRIKVRNAVETVILVLFLFQILLNVDIGMKAKIYVGVICMIPSTIFSLIGVQGESLSSFIFHFFCYLTKRRVLTEPTGRHRLERNRRIRKRQKKQKKIVSRQGGGRHRQRGKRAEKKTKGGKKTGKAEPPSGKEGPAGAAEGGEKKSAGRAESGKEKSPG